MLKKSFIKLCNIYNIIYSIIKDFCSKEGLERANSLAYIILISFVPFLVSVASISSIFISRDTYFKLEAAMLKSNLPIMGSQISKYMQSFHKNAGQLSFLSFIFLFIISNFMIRSLGHHLTQMYGEKRENRSLAFTAINFVIVAVSAFLLSLGAITTSYLASNIKTAYSAILYLLTIILSILAFTMIYKFLPTNKVKFKQALIAGTIAGVLFEISKKLFAFYIKCFATESIVYGTLATIPIFLLWIYISCLILLGCSSLIAWLKKNDINKDKDEHLN